MVLLVVCQLIVAARANDGSSLWLPREKNEVASALVRGPQGTALDELKTYYRGPMPVRMKLEKNALQGDAYRIVVTTRQIELTASTSNGLLYAAFDLLRMQQLGDIRSKEEHPAFDLRLINHWDNLDGSVERGYAGKSIFYPALSDRMADYARANASLGINGIVINNVNASPKMLSDEWLEKVCVINSYLERYGIRTYLSINFASPMALGGLPTADPLDPQVRQWWREKVDAIYRLMPNFGGFLVKANSEGQPGPGDYQRSHADGANMLAEALQPHGGIVMWRCFVYGANHKGEDRVKQAVSEFQPLDGQFLPNVILQTKNGPLDFQPREPYSPVFDQITKTPNMVELQITQEYLGQSRHLVYLAPMWKEFFSFVSPQRLRGIAGVANVGLDDNWCGHHFSQANWYAFGRLAWNPGLSAEAIAREWLKLTFTRDEAFVNPMTEVMMASREACVDYMMPLGLHHIFQFDHHYGPDPGGFKPDYPLEWCPVYYHQADSLGVGFNRSSTGTNATSQYREPYRSQYDDLSTCPENLLLWFHHVPWGYKMKSGRTLWEELCAHYDRGVAEVDRFHEVWQQMRPLVLLADKDDSRRWQEVEDRLQHQQQNAREWRQTCLDYFRSFLAAPQ